MSEQTEVLENKKTAPNIATIPLQTHRNAWEPSDLKKDNSWKYHFTESDLAEIDIALKKLKKQSIAQENISPENFALPNLQNRLLATADALENDLGVFVFKDLPVEKYNNEELSIIYLGLGSYIGYSLRQSLLGEYLQEVYNKGENLYANTGRGTNSSDKLPWHTDRCDVVSLLCIKKSFSGGESKLASLPNLYNKILTERPDLAQELCSPYYHGRAPFEKQSLSPWYKLPIFTWHENKFASRYLRRFIEISQDIPEVPRFSKKQVEALDYMDKRLNDDDVCLNLAFDEGDIQFINNFTVCHSREGYVDTPEQSRMLMRLWLAAYNGRNLEPAFAPLYGSIKGGEKRGGILF